MIAGTASAAFDRSYTAPKGTPVIDGEIDEIWDYAEWIEVDKPYDGADAASIPEKLKVKLLWDDSYLYVLAEVKDADLNYENDLVEIYLDETNARGGAYDEFTSQTRFRWDGTVIQDSGTNCQNDAKAAGTEIDGGWITEISIELKSGSVAEGSVAGLEFMYNVGDSTADFTQALRWNVDTAAGEAGPYSDNTNFGTLNFGAAPVIETEPEIVEPVADEVVAAPQTGDPMAIVAMLLAGSAALLAKKKNH